MTNGIIKIQDTEIIDLIKLCLDNTEFFDFVDEESYVFDVLETARIFEDFLDETYLSFTKKENTLSVNLITTNLAKRFSEILKKNKNIVLMSGTLHTPKILKEVFGIDDFKIIEAEAKNIGDIKIVRTGFEEDCRYSNFSNGNHSREKYLVALEKCVIIAQKPALVHVNSFSDLPSEEEIERFHLRGIVSREKLRGMQIEDKENEAINKFKKGETEVLFSTKCSRGIDFPGDECKSIIFTKYPNPDVQDAFWKILKQTKPQYYWELYKDKARRELLQKVYRGLRFKNDHVDVLSPDSRVLEFFESWNEK